MHHPNPRALLKPAMRGVLDRIARAQRMPLHLLTPEQAKTFYEAGASVLDLPPHKLKRVEELSVPMRDGSSVAARLYAPALPDDAPGLPGRPAADRRHHTRARRASAGRDPPAKCPMGPRRRAPVSALAGSGMAAAGTMTLHRFLLCFVNER